MGRRRQQSVLFDLMDLASRLPWHVSLVLAILSYVILHALAIQEPPRPDASTQLNRFVLASMLHVLPMVLQYLVPLALCGGAIMSVLKRKRRSALVETVVADRQGSAMAELSWLQFELLVGEGFRRQGYSVVETADQGADGGVDLVLRKDGDSYLIQCKHWKAMKVGVQPVRELYGVMAAAGATGGFVVTSGKFTRPAQDFAQGRNIQLVNGQALKRLLRAGKTGAARPPVRRAASARLEERAARSPRPVVRQSAKNDSTTLAAPNCPKCGAGMVKRVAKRGQHAGKTFWGCVNFSKTGCRGIRRTHDEPAS